MLSSPFMESITKTAYLMAGVSCHSAAIWLSVTTNLANCAYPGSFSSLFARVPILSAHGHARPIYHHRAFSLHTSILVATTGVDVEYPTLWCLCFYMSCNCCATAKCFQVDHAARSCDWVGRLSGAK